MATAMSSASAAFNQTNMIFFFYVVYGEYVCLAPPACFVSLAMVSPNANTSTSKHFTCWEEDQEQGPPLLILDDHAGKISYLRLARFQRPQHNTRQEQTLQ
jgi:hypothetical protein